MKILITGKDSAIGNKLQKWIETKDQSIIISQLDVRDDRWRYFDYSQYNTIVHVAAIVHQPQCKDWELYKKVNADLPYEIAALAKAQGVKQFVFFSTMAIYGIGKVLGTNIISYGTPANPIDMYGKSKFLAEQKLNELADENYKICIVRPPNVYGPTGRGGYLETFTKVMKILPCIPDAYNEVTQSMIHLGNLTECVWQLIKKQKDGVFMPQDNRPISTVDILQLICKAHEWKKRRSKCLGMLIKLFRFIPVVEKAYGGVAYDVNISKIDGVEYHVVSIEDGLLATLKQF